jgi:two-component system, NarL family, nitrate/nitrite response regulator NarL
VEDIRSTPVRVCALESQPIVAQGLSEAFARHGGLTLSGWCAEEAGVSQLISQHGPRLMLVDPSATGGNLLALASKIASSSSDEVSTLVWSDGLSPAERRLVEGLGVASLVDRHLETHELIARCLEISSRAGGKVRDAVSELERGARRLTPKESEVARLASAGLKNREIAAELGIAQGTVKVHLMHVFEKTGLRDRQQLCGYAAQLFPAAGEIALAGPVAAHSTPPQA